MKHPILSIFAFALSILDAPSSSSAAPSSSSTNLAKGLALARKGECMDAVPILESAESARHRPQTAIALGDCYARLGALRKAKSLYEIVALEKPNREHSPADRNAISNAPKKLKATNTRIPTIAFFIPPNEQDVVIKADGLPVDRPTEPNPVDPIEEVTLTISMRGRKTFRIVISLEEGERRVIHLDQEHLAKYLDKPTYLLPPFVPSYFLGVAYRGYVLPRVITSIFNDGGRTLVMPGASVSFTRPMGRLDLTASLDYLALYMPPTPYKLKGTPDTDYEIIESSLSSLQATFDVRWNIPLDLRKRVHFRIGAGIGVGFTFAGKLLRTQAYPRSLTPGDPYTYLPCNGPNDPSGSFRYCNQLRDDADHYGEFSELSWFDGGIRPLVYPWLALPMVGLSFQPTPKVAIDVDIAPSIAGIFTSVGARVAF